MASRSLLFARLRNTALPIRRPVTSPNRTLPGCPAARTITKSPARRRRPVAMTVRKLAGERSDSGLGGETLATFGTPRFQDGASGTGRHSVAETMLAFAPPHFWLKCSLHYEPREIVRIGSVNRENADGLDLGRLLRVGEKVKAQTSTRKKPYPDSWPG